MKNSNPLNQALQKTRILTLIDIPALGSPGCLFGCLPLCQKWPNTHTYVKPFSRLGKSNNWSSQSFAGLTLGLVLYWYGIYCHYVYEMNLNNFVKWMAIVRQQVDVWYDKVSRKGREKKDSVRKRRNRLSSRHQSVSITINLLRLHIRCSESI